jgi:hypothetical protein
MSATPRFVPYVLDNGDVVSARFNTQAAADVLDYLRDVVREHPPRQAGACPECGHYGQDCHGSRAANLLADLQGTERPILVCR